MARGGLCQVGWPRCGWAFPHGHDNHPQKRRLRPRGVLSRIRFHGDRDW